MMVKVAKLFTGILWKRCFDNFIEKLLCRSLFHAYRPRSFTPTGVISERFLKDFRKISAQVLFCEFYQIFQNVFLVALLQNTSVWHFLLNTPFLFVRSTSASENVSFNLGYFKYFWDKHCELLPNSFFWRSWTDSQLWLSWFTANRANDMSETLLEVGNNRPTVFW